MGCSLMRAALRMMRAGAAITTPEERQEGLSCPSGLHSDSEQLFHGLQRAGQLRSLAREAETDVALTPCAEVDARHAPDPAVLDEVSDHPPRHGFVLGARRSVPFGVDPEERIERARRRCAREHIRRRFTDAAVEK